MIPMTQLHTSMPISPAAGRDPQAAIKAECGRLIHAAVISRSFREKLLANPLRSIEAGFCGETFQFPREFKERVKLIQANNLEDFSAQLLQSIYSSNTAEPVPALRYH
jgi:hypothetical protein